jgi:tetratricopeptide (TPR) repeat protein
MRILSTVIALGLVCVCACGQTGGESAPEPAVEIIDPQPGKSGLQRVHQLLKLDRQTNDPEGYLQSFEIRDRYGLRPARPGADISTITEAKNILDKSIADNPNSDEAYVLLGILHSKQAISHPDSPGPLPRIADNAWAMAKNAFEKALAINPGNRDAVWGLVLHDSRPKMIYWPRPKPEIEKSIAICRRCLQFDPDNRLVLINLGILYFLTADQYDQAEQVFRKLVKLSQSPKHERFRLEATEYLGRIYTYRGKFEEAEKTLKESVGLFIAMQNSEKPTYYKGCPFSALGELYQMMDRPKDSRANFIKAGNFDMARQKKEFVKALDLFIRGDYGNAAAFVDNALTAYSNKVAQEVFISNVEVLKGFLGILGKNYPAAESDFAKAKIKNPQNHGVNAGLGHLRIIARDYPGAALLLEEAIREAQSQEDQDDRAEIRFHRFVHDMASLGMGWIMANQSRHNRALLYYDKILANTPDHLLALQSKGVACTALHKLDEAEKLFAKVLKIQPNNQYALAELGIVKLNQGEDQEAEKLFKQALDQDQERYTCPYEGLGLVYLKKGDLTSAKKNFEKAIAINPDMEYKKFNGLAKIYVKEGRREEAIKLLKKSIENHPYDNEAEKLLESLQ